MFQNIFGSHQFGRDNTFNNGVDKMSEIALVYANVDNFS